MKTAKQDGGYSELAHAIMNSPIQIPLKNSVTIRFNSESEAKRFYNSLENANLIEPKNYQILKYYLH